MHLGTAAQQTAHDWYHQMPDRINTKNLRHAICAHTTQTVSVWYPTDNPSSSIPRQLPPSPMRVLPRRIELPFDATMFARITPIRANIVGPPLSATSNSASVAACHSSASCSASGSRVMYCGVYRSRRLKQ